MAPEPKPATRREGSTEGAHACVTGFKRWSLWREQLCLTQPREVASELSPVASCQGAMKSA